MDIHHLIFWFFASMLVIAALGVIASRNPVHSALCLVLTFFTCSVLWMLLEAEFLAIVLVLVYVGAVMVLFLFVVMMLDINLAPLREGFISYLPVGLTVGIVMLLEMVVVLISKAFAPNMLQAAPKYDADYSNTEVLGYDLYTNYLFHFEIAALILLVAIIAAISLTMRRRVGTKYQVPSKQVNVNKQDRVRIVKMKAEKSQ